MSQSAKKNPSQEASSTARRGRARAAGEDVLGHGFAALFRAGFSDATLVLRWAEIAGEEVAGIAHPVKLQEAQDGAVLTLKCDPGAAVFLQHATRALTERLNSYLGARRIARIRLSTGTVTHPAGPPAHPLRVPFQRHESSEPLALGDAINRLARLRASLRK